MRTRTFIYAVAPVLIQSLAAAVARASVPRPGLGTVSATPLVRKLNLQGDRADSTRHFDTSAAVLGRIATELRPMPICTKSAENCLEIPRFSSVVLVRSIDVRRVAAESEKLSLSSFRSLLRRPALRGGTARWYASRGALVLVLAVLDACLRLSSRRRDVGPWRHGPRSVSRRTVRCFGPGPAHVGWVVPGACDGGACRNSSLFQCRPCQIYRCEALCSRI